MCINCIEIYSSKVIVKGLKLKRRVAVCGLKKKKSFSTILFVHTSYTCMLMYMLKCYIQNKHQH